MHHHLARLEHCAGQTVTTVTLALAASHAQYVEFADEVAEDDGTVAGHDGAYYT